MKISDTPRHYCGIFGAYRVTNAARTAISALQALQHRGEESAGITSAEERGRFHTHRGMGLVSQVFDERTARELHGDIAIGHTRYSTTGDSDISNAQPLQITCRFGKVALAHNGNLVNTEELRGELADDGAAFQTTTDSEIMLLLLARWKNNFPEAIVSMMTFARGAYALVIMTNDRLVALRDPHGLRPLSIGKLGNGWVVASETCAFDQIGAAFERDIRPGEVVTFENGTMSSFETPQTIPCRGRSGLCAFERIYFARPDSVLEGAGVYSTRMEMGRILATEHPVEADAIVPIPDGGRFAAIGYSRQSGIPLDEAFNRNHYVGRSFIRPHQTGREMAADTKLNLIAELVRGKRVIVVDDSIVRGTTCKKRVAMLRRAGAKEVHVRISCPPHRHPCNYGIDFPDHGQLIAHGRNVKEICDFLGLDSLGYLSIDGLKQALGPRNHCLACFNGNYPVH